VSVLRLVDKLPNTAAGRTVAGQLASSATSVSANYRGSCNARSRREFISKLGVVVEESDESVCWLELIDRCSMLPAPEIAPVLRESIELRNIFAKIRRHGARHRAFAPQGNVTPIDQITK